MDQITLTASKRMTLGKRNDQLRRLGKLPGVVYGHNLASQPIEVSIKDFIMYLIVE